MKDRSILSCACVLGQVGIDMVWDATNLAWMSSLGGDRLPYRSEDTFPNLATFSLVHLVPVQIQMLHNVMMLVHEF